MTEDLIGPTIGPCRQALADADEAIRELQNAAQLGSQRARALLAQMGLL